MKRSVLYFNNGPKSFSLCQHKLSISHILMFFCLIIDLFTVGFFFYTVRLFLLEISELILLQPLPGPSFPSLFSTCDLCTFGELSIIYISACESFYSHNFCTCMKAPGPRRVRYFVLFLTL